ncbi:hypothetical protein VKT23_006294 [Stygiomarasmius scandens]|uniref:F-box domain-containing protein n=1 Tax=Marasmiellus scandens TaxID=2682957 RepID=A0ABR1JRR3_9AGAR
MRSPVEVQHHVLDGLSPVGRIRFSLTSKQSHQIVSSYNLIAFWITRILSRYFDTPSDIVYFRSLQYALGVIISGSSAIQFFDSTTYPDSDLDLYVKISNAISLMKFLLQKGYVIMPDQSSDWQVTFAEALNKSSMTGREHDDAERALPQREDYDIAGIAAIFNFKKQGKHVQVIACWNTPLEAILHFHSTCVLNLISHSHAYSLYPYATFEDRISIHIPIERMSSVTDADFVKRRMARQKYVHRGWRTAPTPSAAAYLCPNSEFRNELRYVGDSKCWTVPLELLPELGDLNRSVPMRLEDDPVRANVWRNNSTTLNAFRVEHNVLYTSKTQLRNAYCISGTIWDQISPFFSDRGLGLVDSEYVRLIHKLCKAYNKNVTINGEKIASVRSLEDTVEDCVQKIVSIFFTNAEHSEGVAYDL